MMADETPFLSLLPFSDLDDSSFNLAFYEFSHGLLSYDAGRLETLLFNPFERPELFNVLSSHLNPDSNFITRLPNSGYMVEEDLNNRVASFGDKTNFSITHLNTWSLMRNFDQINFLLRNFWYAVLRDWCARNVASSLRCRARKHHRIQFFLQSS